MAGKRRREATIVHSGFAALVTEIKGRIQAAQTRAMLAVNAELVRLYWDIGRILDERQKCEGWGAGVIPRLAKELKNDLPEIKGLSERNIDRMIAFHRSYPVPSEFSPPPVAKLPARIVQDPLAQLSDSLLWCVPWAHHVILIEKVKDLPTRRWYMEQTLANGWSRNILALQIDAQAHARHGKAVSNFAAMLPAPQSDLVQQTLKDPYMFDFLTLTEPKKFLLELGQGFTFVEISEQQTIAAKLAPYIAENLKGLCYA